MVYSKYKALWRLLHDCQYLTIIFTSLHNIPIPGTPKIILRVTKGVPKSPFEKSKSWLYKYPKESKDLLLKIADVCADLLVGQVLAGAQVSYSYQITFLSFFATYSISYHLSMAFYVF